MSRIANYGSSTNLVRYMLQTQQNILKDTNRATSGKIAEQYSGITKGAQRLVNLENLTSINDRFMLNNSVMNLRLQAGQDAISSMKNAVTSFRTELLSFQSKGVYDIDNVAKIQKWAFDALKTMESYLNTSVDGVQIFSGSRTDTDAVDMGLTTLAAFQEKYDGSLRTYPTTRDQHLTTLTASEDTNNSDSLYITNSNWLTFRRDNDGDATTAGVSSIEATSAMFSNLKVGSLITVSNSGSNNGNYTVASVSSDGTKVTVNTDMFTDETIPLDLVDEAAAAAVSFAPLSGTTLTNADTGNVTFSATNRTITGLTAGAFSSFSVGQVIQISGSTSNNGTFEISAISTDGTELTIGNPPLTVTLPDGSELAAAELAKTVFSRSGDTLTSTLINAFQDVSVGDTITLAGSARNNGTYTVKAIGSNNTQLTIESVKLTDEGLSSGNSFFNFDGSSKAVFNASAKTIQAQTSGGTALANAYSGVHVGDTVTIAGSDFDFSSNTQVVFTANGGAPNGTIQIQDSTGAAYTGVFADLSVGDTFTVANSGSNNTTFTVNYVSEDGSTVTVDEAVTSETDTNGTSFTGDVTFTAATQMVFTAPSTLEIQPNGGGAAIAGAFPAGLAAGSSFTIAGGPNAGTYVVATNDGTTITTVETTIASGTAAGDVTMNAAMNDGDFTVTAVSSDGSTITVSETILDQTDTDGTTVSVSDRNFSTTTGTKLSFDATNDRIKAITKKDGAAATGVFSALRSGQTLTVAGSQNNNGTLTIDTVASNGSYVDLTDDITTAETDPVAGLDVYAAAGTIATGNNYYQGDSRVMTHRVDQSRTIDMNVTAADPVFEKVLRALSIIAQGEFGTEGGLDQHKTRVDDALYLLYDALHGQAPGTPPYGDEEPGDFETVAFDLSFKQITIKDLTETQKATNVIYKEWISGSEDADPLETIARLQAEKLSLEVSYESVSQIFNMSLINFLK